MMSHPSAGRARVEDAAALARQGTALLERTAAPLLDLWIRLTIAPIFLRSGLQKLQDWGSTRYLFESEYRVPLLPPDAAAILATAMELSMPVLIVAGLATRLAAVPLLAMAMVIQFVVGATNPAFDNPQHILWMVLLTSLVVRGAGPISLDHLIARSLAGRRP